MILERPARPVQMTGAGIVHRASEDPRIAAMARLCKAIDEGLPRDVVAISREFRSFGLSICVIKPPGRGGA